MSTLTRLVLATVVLTFGAAAPAMAGTGPSCWDDRGRPVIENCPEFWGSVPWAAEKAAPTTTTPVPVPTVAPTTTVPPPTTTTVPVPTATTTTTAAPVTSSTVIEAPATTLPEAAVPAPTTLPGVTYTSSNPDGPPASWLSPGPTLPTSIVPAPVDPGTTLPGAEFVPTAPSTTVESSGTLPRTGTNSTLAVVGVVLLAAGGLLVVARRLV